MNLDGLEEAKLFHPRVILDSCSLCFVGYYTESHRWSMLKN